MEKLKAWAEDATRPGGHFEKHGLTYRGLFKAPLGLGSLGLYPQAARATDILQRQFLLPNGDFADPPTADPDIHGAPSLQYFYPYRISWILAGVQRLGRYDVAVPVGKFLAGLQDPQSGGFRATPSSPYCHLCGTAQAAVAAMSMGQWEAAARAADFLAAAYARQPRPDKIHYVFDAKMNVVEDWPADANHRLLEKGRSGQSSYLAALPAALLALMYRWTKKTPYLDAALGYYNFVCEVDRDVFDNPAAGKLAWACALLYRITGEEKYRDNAWRAAAPLIATIAGTPVMHVKAFYPDFNRQPISFTYEVAFEQAYWLAEIVKELGAGPDPE